MMFPNPLMAKLLALFDIWDVNASGMLEADGAPPHPSPFTNSYW